MDDDGVSFRHRQSFECISETFVSLSVENHTGTAVRTGRSEAWGRMNWSSLYWHRGQTKGSTATAPSFRTSFLQAHSTTTKKSIRDAPTTASRSILLEPTLFFSFGPGFVLRCIFVRFLCPTRECFWSDFQLNYEPVPSFCLCHEGRRGPL